MDAVPPGSFTWRRELLVAAALVSALSLALAGVTLYLYFNEGQQRRDAAAQAIRTVLCYFDSLAPPQEQPKADRVYAEALAQIHARPCPPRRSGR